MRKKKKKHNTRGSVSSSGDARIVVGCKSDDSWLKSFWISARKHKVTPTFWKGDYCEDLIGHNKYSNGPLKCKSSIHCNGSKTMDDWVIHFVDVHVSLDSVKSFGSRLIAIWLSPASHFLEGFISAVLYRMWTLLSWLVLLGIYNLEWWSEQTKTACFILWKVQRTSISSRKGHFFPMKRLNLTP